MKYKLRLLNCVQETDSEERRDELLEKGYKLEGAGSKKQKQKDKSGKNTQTGKGEDPLDDTGTDGSESSSQQLETEEKKG